MKYWEFVRNKTDTEEETVELRISGDIVSDDDAWFYEWFGIETSSPNAFRAQLAEHKNKPIAVWIDSYGGDVFAGVGIYNALMEHKGKVTVKVDGKAMSAASTIAMAGSETLMSPGSIMMIHNPWSYASGDSKEMRRVADYMDEVKEGIINGYQIKTKRSRNKIAEMMDDETFMSAQTAVKEGFADGILYTDKASEAVSNDFKYSRIAIQNSANERLRDFISQHKAELKDLKETDQIINRQAPVFLLQSKINLNRRRANV